MAVSLNENWKIPIGYFLINGLNNSERAQLLSLALENLHDHQCQVFSITFDGAPTNYGMCAELGANFDYYGKNFKPYFPHPIAQEPTHVIPDLCHNDKLVRNALGDWKELGIQNQEQNTWRSIKWAYIVGLHDIQVQEGIRAANKLRNKRINYRNNIMDVKIAMQTLSGSVSKSLNFMRLLPHKLFLDSEATVEFFQNFNDMADLLNCKNKFSKEEYNCPLTDETYPRLKYHADRFIKYIENLTDKFGTCILKTKRKTGFLGMIMCLTNIFPLFEKLKTLGSTYLLTYKLSQDYIETYFSAIRGCNGFNNNPNALELKTCVKRLLVRHELKEFNNAELIKSNLEFDHDYISTHWALLRFVEESVLYIAGYVSHKLITSVVIVKFVRLNW